MFFSEPYFNMFPLRNNGERRREVYKCLFKIRFRESVYLIHLLFTLFRYFWNCHFIHGVNWWTEFILSSHSMENTVLTRFWTRKKLNVKEYHFSSRLPAVCIQQSFWRHNRMKHGITKTVRSLNSCLQLIYLSILRVKFLFEINDHAPRASAVLYGIGKNHATGSMSD